MEYVRLGKSGLQLSRIALGAMAFGDSAWRPWVLDRSEAAPVIKRALDLGINVIDTCNYYSLGASESLIGDLLKNVVSRRDLVIATKFGYAMSQSPNDRGYSRKHIMEAVDASLRRLGVDHIDLYQTHIWDSSANIEEMVQALADIVRAGKVLYVGATDMPTWQMAKAVYLAKAAGLPGFVSYQYHYNLIWREPEREAMPFCRDEQIGLLPYSPLARGFLCGRTRRTGSSATLRAKTDGQAREWYGREADEGVMDVVQSIASERKCRPAQIALAWVLAQPGVTAPIFGATNSGQVDDAVAALDILLEPDELERLKDLYSPRANSAHG